MPSAWANVNVLAYMKRFRKLLRTCGLLLFLILSVGGVSLTGVAPTPPKGRKILGTESVMEVAEQKQEEEPTDVRVFS
jgi:hypothetical protein